MIKLLGNSDIWSLNFWQIFYNKIITGSAFDIFNVYDKANFKCFNYISIYFLYASFKIYQSDYGQLAINLREIWHTVLSNGIVAICRNKEWFWPILTLKVNWSRIYSNNSVVFFFLKRSVQKKILIECTSSHPFLSNQSCRCRCFQPEVVLEFSSPLVQTSTSSPFLVSLLNLDILQSKSRKAIRVKFLLQNHNNTDM